MKIKLNGIEFEVTAVEPALREAILGDPVIAKAVWRDVYAWDAAAQGPGARPRWRRYTLMIIPN